jgi:hypothetical protein
MPLTNDMNNLADTNSIDDYASIFLKSSMLPKKIHDLLQTIFTKREAKFREHIMVVKQGDHNKKHSLKQGSHAVVGNTLILLTLLDSASTKKLLEYYFSTLTDPSIRNFDKFFANFDNKSPAYFFCGIDKSDIDNVKAYLEDEKFHLFTQKLPLPVKDKSYILHLLSQDIPWQQYLKSYQDAEHCFYRKDVFAAKEILEELSSKTLIKLIPVKLLLAKVNTEINEAEEAASLISDLLG